MVDIPPDRESGPAQPVRASDADRSRVAAVISDAAAAGMLTMEEADDRLATVFGATYQHQLTGVTADLPAPQPERRDVTRGRWPVAAVVIGAVVLFAVLGAVFHDGGPNHDQHGPMPWLLIPIVLLVIRFRGMGRRHGWQSDRHDSGRRS